MIRFAQAFFGLLAAIALWDGLLPGPSFTNLPKVYLQVLTIALVAAIVVLEALHERDLT